jgi:hypothetical protein
MTLITHIYLALRLRMNGSTPLLSYMPLQYGENQLHISAGPINTTAAKHKAAMPIIPKLVL